MADLDVIFMMGNFGESDAHLIRAIEEGAFYFIQKPFDRRVLQTLVGRCIELRTLRMAQKRHLHELKDELTQARRFQESMLPPGRCTRQGTSIFGNELAGDFYDYTHVAEDFLALIIADVSGHGASAALLTGVVKSAFHSAHEDDFEPGRIIRRVVDNFRSFEPDRFVSLFCARLDLRSLQLLYINAGHPATVLTSERASPELLPSTGPIICSTFESGSWEQACVDLEPGHGLLAYTGGVTEARGSQGESGADRLIRVLTTETSKRGDQVLEHILNEVRLFSGRIQPDDDMTLLSLQVGAWRTTARTGRDPFLVGSGRIELDVPVFQPRS